MNTDLHSCRQTVYSLNSQLGNLFKGPSAAGGCFFKEEEMSFGFNRATGLLLLAISAGCAPKPIAMDHVERASLSSGQELRILYYEPPDFKVPPGTMPLIMFGAVGGAIAAANMEQSQGQQTVKEYDVQDPIIQVRRKFVPRVGSLLNVDMFGETTPRQDDDLDSLKKEFGEGYILDLGTSKWGIFRKPFETFHYVAYRGRARIIRVSEAKIIWQGVCDLEEKDNEHTPHITEFEANNGALLKDNLAKLAASCSDELLKQLAGNEMTR